MFAQLDPLYIKMRPAKSVARVISHIGFQGRPLTTKARWINYVTVAVFELAKRLPQVKRIESPIFILGTGRSGTTILGKVLSIHRDIGWLNEPKLLWHVVYPEEDLVGSYGQEEAHYRLNADQATEDVRRAIHRLYGLYLFATGSRRVLDKYPEMIFRVSFIRSIFPDAKFLFLVRNGWDTVRSIEQWSKRDGVEQKGEVHDWWGVNNRKWRLLIRDIVASDPALSDAYADVADFTRHEDMAAVEWTTTMREGLRLSKSMPDSIHQVRFEELMVDPEQTLEKLSTFCELPEDATMLEYAQRILSPPPSKSPFELHSAIQPLFIETMGELDYPAGEW